LLSGTHHYASMGVCEVAECWIRGVLVSVQVERSEAMVGVFDTLWPRPTPSSLHSKTITTGDEPRKRVAGSTSQSQSYAVEKLHACFTSGVHSAGVAEGRSKKDESKADFVGV
jgi:hypothetical protein